MEYEPFITNRQREIMNAIQEFYSASGRNPTWKRSGKPSAYDQAPPCAVTWQISKS